MALSLEVMLVWFLRARVREIDRVTRVLLSRHTQNTSHQWGYILWEFDIARVGFRALPPTKCATGNLCICRRGEILSQIRRSQAVSKGFFAANCPESGAGILRTRQAEPKSHLPLWEILRFVYTFALRINYHPGRQAVNCWVLSQHNVINLAGGLPAEPMISSHFGPSEVVLLSSFIWRKQTLLCLLERLLGVYQMRQV